MEATTTEPRPADSAPPHPGWRAPRAEFSAADRALLALGRALAEADYRFTAVTPASHQRVYVRKPTLPASLTDIFGWSRPFRATDLSSDKIDCLAEAGLLHRRGSMLRSGVRFATIGDRLFAHSSFPTVQSDAVFFGPDTYRFVRFIQQSLNGLTHRRSLRVLDVGAGSGAGGLYAATMLGATAPSVVLSDINPTALRYSRINAALNDVTGAEVIESNLFDEVHGPFDLIVSNPPYLVDRKKRLYRHGGGEFGSGLSLEIAAQAVARLAPGGRLLLYTGSAIVGGVDGFEQSLRAMLEGRGVALDYAEIDPDVFGEELDHSPYDRVDRIAVIAVTVDRIN
jgi:methylase of polypeptide subunit release factors